MNAQQMTRMVKKHRISLVFDWSIERWYAGFCHDRADESFDIAVEHEGSLHCAKTPEEAVEDYCNARNLEWDTP